MTAPVRCVLFDQTLAGTLESARDALASLEAAGFTARQLDQGLYGPDGLAWIVAETVMPSPPSGDDQTALMQRATDAARSFGYELRLHGVTWGWTTPDGGA